MDENKGVGWVVVKNSVVGEMVREEVEVVFIVMQNLAQHDINIYFISTCWGGSCRPILCHTSQFITKQS